MLKIGQNWGKIANYPPNAQQRFAPLPTYCPSCVRWLFLNFYLHNGLGPFFKGRKIVCVRA